MKKNMSVAMCGLLLIPSLCNASDKNDVAKGALLGSLVTAVAGAVLYYRSNAARVQSSNPSPEKVAPIGSDRVCKLYESEIKSLYMQLEQNKKYELHAIESIADVVAPESREELKNALKNSVQRPHVTLKNFVENDRWLQLQHFGDMKQKSERILMRIEMRKKAIAAWKAQQEREIEMENKKKAAEATAINDLSPAIDPANESHAAQILNPGKKGDYAETSEA